MKHLVGARALRFITSLLLKLPGNDSRCTSEYWLLFLPPPHCTSTSNGARRRAPESIMRRSREAEQLQGPDRRSDSDGSFCRGAECVDRQLCFEM